jgi:hypothetical protein
MSGGSTRQMGGGGVSFWILSQDFFTSPGPVRGVSFPKAVQEGGRRSGKV